MDTPILFRFDASAAIGYGHATRCYALSQELSARGYRPHFAVSADTVELLNRLGVEPEQQHVIDCATGGDGDIATTAKLARELSTEWIIIDGYEFNGAYQAGLKAHSPKRLLVVDDGVLDSFHADIILNQNLGAEVNHRYVPTSAQMLLLGSRYTLFRRSFRGVQPITPHATVKNVTLIFGGSDPKNITVAILSTLSSAGLLTGRHVRAIHGSEYQHRHSLEQVYVPTDCTLELLSYSASITDVYTWSDVVVSAAGSSAWELALLGIPMALVSAADNQLQVVRALAERRAAIDLGDIRAFNTTHAAQHLSTLFNDYALRQELHTNCVKLIDCEGAGRVVDAIEEYQS